MGSHFAQNTTTKPCSLLNRHKPVSGIFTYTKHPQPHPKTPVFLAWTWKWAKWTTVWAKWTPTGQNVWNVGKRFLEVGKKKLFMVVPSKQHISSHCHFCLFLLSNHLEISSLHNNIGNVRWILTTIPMNTDYDSWKGRNGSRNDFRLAYSASKQGRSACWQISDNSNNDNK